MFSRRGLRQGAAQPMLRGQVASRQSLERLRWRLANLSAREFVGSLFPRTIHLDRLDLEDFERRYAARLRPAARPAEARPFLVIKPEGLPHEDRIRQALEEHGTRIESVHEIDDYVGLQLSLLGQRDAESRRDLVTVCLRIEADRARWPDCYDRAKILVLDGVDPDHLGPLKKLVRSRIGPMRFVKVTWNGLSETVYSSYVHVPDREDIDGEFAVVKRFV